MCILKSILYYNILFIQNTGAEAEVVNVKDIKIVVGEKSRFRAADFIDEVFFDRSSQISYTSSCLNCFFRHYPLELTLKRLSGK